MNLLIIGAGQYGMVVREIAQATGRFDKIDFLDDNNAVAIDSTNNISKWVSEYKIAIVAIGKADVREKYLTLLKQCGYELATIIHPDAYISPTATTPCPHPRRPVLSPRPGHGGYGLCRPAGIRQG